jgi:hypothetical protein
MIADFMSGAVRLFNYIGILLHFMTDYEEGSFGVVLFESVQDFERLLARTVVEGKCHYFLHII